MVSAAQQTLIDASLSPGVIAGKISSAVAAKSMNVERQEGADVLDLLEGATDAGAQAGDPLVAKATGVGGLLDVMG
jgi:hypothetical protein